MSPSSLKAAILALPRSMEIKGAQPPDATPPENHGLTGIIRG